jgi:hypothetical protein
MNAFLHPAKSSANNATIKSESLLLQAKIGSVIMTATHEPSLLLLYIHDNPAIMTVLNAQNLLLFFAQNDPAIQDSNGRGSGGKNVIFSNGPNSTSECSKLLY